MNGGCWPLSLLYLPNEGVEGTQAAPRDAFQQLAREGKLSRYEVFSYLVEAGRSGTAAALAGLLKLAREAHPDVLLWQHVGDFPVTRRYLAELRAAAPRTHLVYHEGDVYGRWIKRMPPPVRRLMAAADTVALVGRGEYAALARSAGARRVIYSPNAADTVHFGKPWTPTPARELDVLLVGNRVTSLRPWGSMPGAAAREALVRALGRRFGNRFAVHGRGWSGFTGDRGPVPYPQQEEVQRRAWVTASWEHFDTVDGFFSDRLPNSLLSGVPHVTNHHPGYEEVFGSDAPLRWARSVGEHVALVEALLALGPAALDDLGRRAQAYVRGRFAARLVYERLLVEAVGGPR